MRDVVGRTKLLRPAKKGDAEPTEDRRASHQPFVWQEIAVKGADVSVRCRFEEPEMGDAASLAFWAVEMTVTMGVQSIPAAREPAVMLRERELDESVAEERDASPRESSLPSNHVCV